MGSSIGDVLAAPVARVCEGVEDRKTAVHLPDGRTIPISVSSSRILNRSGGAIGVVVVCRDLRDVDALRNQLLSSGRLAAVGELAAGIAHEVNNPVAFMRADLNLLAERIDELRGYVAASDRPDEDLMIFERSRRRVRNAIAGIERVTEVVRDVREFAHVGGAGQGGSDPESVIRGAMRLARLQRGDEVELRLTSSTCDERIDSGQELKQVTLALLRMLVTAAAKGSRLEVDLRTDSQDLVLGLSTGPLADSAGDLLSRFDVLGDQGLAGSPDEYGLGVAVELVEQLGGGLAIEATRSDAVRIEVSMPIHFGTISS